MQWHLGWRTLFSKIMNHTCLIRSFLMSAQTIPSALSDLSGSLSYGGTWLTNKPNLILDSGLFLSSKGNIFCTYHTEHNKNCLHSCKSCSWKVMNLTDHTVQSILLVQTTKVRLIPAPAWIMVWEAPMVFTPSTWGLLLEDIAVWLRYTGIRDSAFHPKPWWRTVYYACFYKLFFLACSC